MRMMPESPSTRRMTLEFPSPIGMKSVTRIWPVSLAHRVRSTKEAFR